MPDVSVDGLTFQFPPEWRVSKYDDWNFYRRHFARVANSKAMDIIALSPDGEAWLIEVKDYRRPNTPKPSDLPCQLVQKVRDTIAGLVAKKFNNGTQDCEFELAKDLLSSSKLNLVFHLEQPEKPSKLFPRAFDPANVKAKMTQLRAIDPHYKIVNKTCSSGLEWSVI